MAGVFKAAGIKPKKPFSPATAKPQQAKALESAPATRPAGGPSGSQLDAPKQTASAPSATPGKRRRRAGVAVNQISRQGNSLLG